MASLEELQRQRADLASARANGLREVRDSDGSAMAYKSDAEMAAALRALDSEITALQRGGRGPSVVRFTSSKGL